MSEPDNPKEPSTITWIWRRYQTDHKLGRASYARFFKVPHDNPQIMRELVSTFKTALKNGDMQPRVSLHLLLALALRPTPGGDAGSPGAAMRVRQAQKKALAYTCDRAPKLFGDMRKKKAWFTAATEALEEFPDAGWSVDTLARNARWPHRGR